MACDTHKLDPKCKGRKRLRVLFPLSRVSRTLRGGLEPHSMAGCVETLTSPLKAWEKEGGLESPFLCKSCSATVGRPQDFHVKAKPPGPQDIEGLS